MKKLLFILIALCYSSNAIGQYEDLSSVTVGKDFKGKGKWNRTLFNAVKDDGSIYSVAYRARSTKKIVIDLFNSKMGHEKQYYIKANKNFVIQSGKYINDDLIFIGIDAGKSIAKTFKVDFKNEELIEVKEVFNFADLKRTKAASKVQIGGIINAIALYSAERKRDIDVYGVFESSPYGGYYVYSRDLKSDNNKREMHQIVVLDSNYDIVYDQLIDIAVEDKLMEMLSFNVDENGNVVVIAKKYEEGKRKEGKRKKDGAREANYHMEFIVVNKEKVLVQKFQEDGIFINDLTALVDNNEIFIGSYYSDENEGRSKGVLTSTYNLVTLERIAFSKTPFTDKVIANLNGTSKERKVKRKKKREDTKLKGHSLLIGNDGSITFIGEENYTTTRSSYNSSSGTWRERIIYHFDDILVTKIKPNGELGYFKVINKRQSSSGVYNDIYSFSSFLVNDKIQLFMNAGSVSAGNNQELIIKTKKEKKLSLYNVQIGNAGVITYKKVLDVVKRDNIAMGIRDATMIKDIGFITSGNDGKTKRYMKVLF